MSGVLTIWLLALAGLSFSHISLDPLSNGFCGVYQREKHLLQPTCFGYEVQNYSHSSNTEIKNQTLKDEPFLPSRRQVVASSPHWTSPPQCIDRGNMTEVYCIFTSATFANGRGISIFTTPENAAAIAKLPAFEDPTVHDENEALNSSPPPYELRELPGRGIGVIANRTLHRGDRIFSETPSYMIDDQISPDVDDELHVQMQRYAVLVLPEPLRDLSLDLCAHFGVADRIDDIMATNAFAVDMFDDGKAEYDVEPTSYNSLLPAISVRASAGPRQFAVSANRPRSAPTTTVAPIQTTTSTRRRSRSTCMPRRRSTRVKRSPCRTLTPCSRATPASPC
jgi:hypothetical protein